MRRGYDRAISKGLEIREAHGARGASLAPPAISICILAGHDLEHLEACLASLRGQASPPSFEVLVGGDPSPELTSGVRRQFPRAQVCDTRRRLPGAARNVLMERARGALLLFLDDDVTVASTLLVRLAALAARHPEVSVFGGPNETPPGSSRFQVVQGAVLSSLAGSGPVSRRYGARRPGLADERWFTLCNLAVRREVMVPFLSDLVCAEENALLGLLRRHGNSMLYAPSLRVFHARRATLGSFARQMFKYGRGRGQLLALRPGGVRAAYLVPSAFLIYLVLLLALIAQQGASLVALAPLALYCALVALSGLWIARTLRRPASALLAPWLLVTVHLCYGAGVLTGLLERRSSQLCYGAGALGGVLERRSSRPGRPTALQPATHGPAVRARETLRLPWFRGRVETLIDR